MRPVRGTVVGMLAARTRPGWRRAILGVLFIVFLVLTFFPERYRSAVTMAPTDPNSLGLSSTLGQLGAISNVFGSQTAIEVSLRVARGIDVRKLVIQKMDLVKSRNFGSEIAAHRWLERNVDIRALRGGILQIDYLDRDPLFAKKLIEAFTSATRLRLAEINRQQTAYKRDILNKLVGEAFDRRERAQAAFDAFRLRTRYSSPAAAIEGIGDRVPQIEAQIKGREVALNAARQFATDENMSIRQIVAEIDALKRQLREAEALNPREKNSVGRVVEESTEVNELLRELYIARSLFDSYSRFLEGTAVEDLTSMVNLRVLEPPYVDSARQLYLPAGAIALIILLLGLSVEFYQMRPPVGGLEPPA